MHPNLPDLLPGEIYQGWLERVRILNNYQRVQTLHRDLRAIALSRNPRLIDHFHEIGAAVTATDYADFIAHHTLVPFLQLSNRAHYFREGRWIASPWNYHNDSVSHTHSAAKKCPKCEDFDLQKQGFRYLRRDHQIPGVTWCLIHRCTLEWVDPNLQGDMTPIESPGAFDSVKARVFEMICGAE